MVAAAIAAVGRTMRDLHGSGDRGRGNRFKQAQFEELLESGKSKGQGLVEEVGLEDCF